MGYEAVIFDLGGVIFGSPLPAIARYEQETGLEPGSIGKAIEATGGKGAWARHERGELGYAEFCSELESDLAAAGIQADARRLMRMVERATTLIPSMVRLVASVSAVGLRTAALTNNWVPEKGDEEGFGALRDHFDVFVESSRVGMRKPEPAIYEHVLGLLGIEAAEAVFLDDLGPNLKPARRIGMTTIKVTDPEQAISALESTLGVPLR